MTNLIAQFNLNKNKVMLALPECYQAFKKRIEETALDTKQENSGIDGNTIVLTSDKPYSMVGKIAVLEFNGFTVNNCSELEEMFYGCISLQGFCQKLQMAIDDEDVDTVVIDFDSGGGYVGYGDETCQLVKELSQKKQIFAYTSGLMCSQAYAIACNCNYIIASPTALVGSIGTYCEYITYNGASELSPDGITVSNLKDFGVTVTTFQGGTDKTIGSESIALNDDQKKKIMADIEEMNNAFKSMVNTNRNGVKDEFMQGQPFYGKEAVKMGTNLIDGTVNSLSQFIQFLSSNK